MRLPLHFAVLLVASSASAVLPAGEMRAEKNIPYSEGGGRQTSLDVYRPSDGKDHPVVVWVHGGGWRIGDKDNLQQKPVAFVDRGFVLVSIDYRLHPEASYREQGQDVARAIRWVREHIGEYGGNPSELFLMGHSAGAHLAALVATDHRYLAGEQLTLDVLRGVVLLDGAGYDIPRQIELAVLPRSKRLYTTIFGEDATKQKDASPITHVTHGKGIPPFLILYVAHRRDSRAQSISLVQKLNEVGVEANAVAAENKTHATINRELGQAGDEPTREVFAFLQERLETPKAASGRD